MRGIIKTLQKGVYIEFKYYNKITHEVEQLLLLNKTPAKNHFILEFVIKTNVNPKTSFKEFFKVLET